LFYEQDLFTAKRLYNFVITDLAIDGLRFTRLSSLHVEDASFFKLDNLSLAKTFPLGRGEHKKHLKISFTGQNLFVLTDYTGADPEPVLEDLGVDLFGDRQNDSNDANPLAAGIDRRNYYLPARTFVIGLGLAF
jgi:iron complex outermembrane receptor protein